MTLPDALGFDIRAEVMHSDSREQREDSQSTKRETRSCLVRFSFAASNLYSRLFSSPHTTSMLQISVDSLVAEVPRSQVQGTVARTVGWQGFVVVIVIYRALDILDPFRELYLR